MSGITYNIPPSQDPVTMAQISPDSFDGRLRSGGESPLILDIRPPDDFQEWHVPGSTNIDLYDQLQDDPAAAEIALAELPETSRDIVTVCAAGAVSDIATSVLSDMGYDAMTLEDGLYGWSRVHRTAEVPIDIDGTLIQVARPGKGCLSYVLVSHGEAAVFDPSRHLHEYEAVVDEYDADPVAVLDTHGHADHVSGGRSLAERLNVPYHLHPADAVGIDAAPLADGQTLTVGAVTVEAIHTPGHSPGGVTFDVGGEAVLTGDTLFHESVGRVELGVEAGLEDADAADNAAALYDSLQRLLNRSGDPLVLPAHDPGTPDPPVAARVSEVQSMNPDLSRDRDEFIEALSNDIPDHPPNFERVKKVNAGLENASEDELSTLELGPNRCAAE